MAQFALPPHLTSDCTIFTVGNDGHGHWVVQENHGLLGGTFARREDAMHYAQDECRCVPGAIVLVSPQPVELRLAG